MRAVHQKTTRIRGARVDCRTVTDETGKERRYWDCPYPLCGCTFSRCDRLQVHHRDAHSTETVARNRVSPIAEENSVPAEGPQIATNSPAGTDTPVARNHVTPIAEENSVPPEPTEDPQVATNSPAETDTPEVLSKAHLSVVKYGTMNLLSCVSCGVILDGSRPKAVVSHVRRDLNPCGSRRRLRWPREECELLEQAVGSMVFTSLDAAKTHFRSLSEIVPPVRGLPVRRGFSCDGCHRYHAISWKVMRSHMINEHPRLGSLRDRKVRSCVQCLVQGKGKKYFAVHPNTAETGGDRALTEALEKSIARTEASLRPDRAPPAREVNPFLRCTEWHLIAEELWPKDSSFDSVKGSMLVSQGDPSAYSRLPEAVRLYARFARQVVHKQLLFTTRTLVWRDDHKADAKGFKNFLDDRTVDKYCPIMTGLLLCLLRSACDRPSGLVHVVKAPDVLKGHAENLKSQLMELRDLPFPEDFDMTVIHRMVLAVWTPPHGTRLVTKRSKDDLFTQYMILNTIQSLGPGTTPSYAWKDVTGVTQALSMLKHWCRLAVEMELARNLWDPSQPEGMLNSAAEELLVYTNETVKVLPTPYSQVSSWQKLASTVAGQSDVVPHLYSTDPDSTWCIYDGRVITIDGVRATVMAVIQDAHTIMREEVLKGLDTDWILPLLEPGDHILDSLNKNDVWYSFLTDHRNPFREHEMDLHRHLFTGDMTKNHFVLSYSGDHVVFNRKSLRCWEASCDRLFGLLNILIHTTFGQPGRAAEYGSFVLRNPGTNRRSFFWSDETIAIHQTQTKNTNSEKTVQPITRFAPFCLRLLFLQYLCLVRPVLSFVAGELYDDPSKVASLYKDCWFVTKGARCLPRSLSEGLQREFGKHCDLPLRTRGFRHVCKFFSASIRLLSIHLRSEGLDNQSGHGLITAARKYAINSATMNGVNHFSWEDQRFQSLKLQQHLLRLPWDAKDLRSGGMLQLPVDDTVRASAVWRPAGLPTVRPCPGLEVSFSPASKRPRPGPPVHLHCERQNGLREEDDGLLDAIEEDAWYAAAHARDRFGHKSWKTPQQATAVAMAVDNSRNFLAILPTGSGKSLIFMAAARASPKMVVVVVPLFVLIEGHLASCKAANIPCFEYRLSGSVPAGAAGIVFVPAEIALTEHFRVWARTLISKGELHSIVVDEVHLALCAFRSSMRQLHLLSYMQCQFIGLTASLPPRKEGLLRSRLGWDNVRVIRSHTVRANLHYEVIEEEDIDEKIVLLLEAWLTAPPAHEGDRALVYCMTKGEVERAQERLRRRGLNSSHLHSSLPEDQKRAELKTWVQGTARIMVATGVIGCGFDYPRVRLVIHRGAFYSLEYFHQQSGRCSRDGEIGHCPLVSNSGYRKEALAWHHKKDGTSQDELQEFQRGLNWIEDNRVCRRYNLHKEVDEKGVVCVLYPGAVSCDTCSRRSVQVHRQPKPRGNGSQHWGPRLPDLHGEADEEGPAWRFNLRPEAAQRESDMHSDIRDYRLVRRVAGDKQGQDHCLLCYNHGAKIQKHSPTFCGVVRGSGKSACLRCMDREHDAKSCKFKVSDARENHRTCYRCFFPLERVGDVRLHLATGDCTDCKDNSGERIRTLIWHFYRDDETKKRLKSKFSDIPLRGAELELWLVTIAPGRVVNNFVRVAAFVMREKHWDL